MLDLAAIRSLIAVRDHGSVVAAAEALGFTPSAVSQQIKRLERQSGSLMLERVGRSVILSERARLLAVRGERLLDDLAEMEHLALGHAEALRGSLRVASFSTGARGIVAPTLKRLRESAPQLHITLIELDPREALAAVERGAADVGIVHDWTTIPLEIGPSLDRHPLMLDQADVLVHAGHPLAGATAISPPQVAEDTWVTTHAGSICHEWVMQMFAMHGLAPDIRYFDATYATHVALVQAGVATALVPRLGRDALPAGVCAIPVANPTPQRRVSVVWRTSTGENPAVRHLHGELASVAQELGSDSPALSAAA